MNVRGKTKPPRSGMVWSEKHRRWVDPDDRTPGRKERDEKLAEALEADQKRIHSALKAAAKAREKQDKALDGAAQSLAQQVLAQLIEARKKAGLTQSEVARRMGLPQSAIVRLEAGTHSPTLSTLSRYAAAIGARLDVRRIA